jgi:hypothetical protein
VLMLPTLMPTGATPFMVTTPVGVRRRCSQQSSRNRCRNQQSRPDPHGTILVLNA